MHKKLKEKSMKVESNLALNIATRSVFTILGMVAGFFLVRYLGPQTYGLLGDYTAILTFVTALGSLGLIESLSKTIVGQEKQDQSITVIRGIVIYVILGLIYGVGVIVLSSSFNKFLKLDVPIGFYIILGLHIFLYLVNGFLEKVLEATNITHLISYTQTAAIIFRVLAVIIIILFKLSYLYVLIVELLMTFMYITTYFRYVARKYVFPFFTESVKLKWDWKWFIKIFRYGLAVYVASIFFLVSQRLPVLIIQALYGESFVAYFNAPLNLVNRLYLPVLALSNIVGPLFGKSDQSANDLGNIFEQSLRFILVIFVPISTVFTFAAPQVIRILYGSEFMAAVPVMQAFGVFLLVSSISTFVSSVINFIGLASKRVRYLIPLLILDVWAMVLATQFIGFYAIPYVLVGSVTILLILDLGLIQSRVRFQISDVLAYLYKIVLLVLPLFVSLIWFGWSHSSGSGIFAFLGIGIVTGGIYLAGIFGLRVVSISEIKNIKAAIRGIVK